MTEWWNGTNPTHGFEALFDLLTRIQGDVLSLSILFTTDGQQTVAHLARIIICVGSGEFHLLSGDAFHFNKAYVARMKEKFALVLPHSTPAFRSSPRLYVLPSKHLQCPVCVQRPRAPDRATGECL